MRKYDVKLHLDDSQHEICLEVHQRVVCEAARSEDELVQQAKQQFKTWAENRGSDWEAVATRVPFATVSSAEIREAS